VIRILQGSAVTQPPLEGRVSHHGM